jgi:threonine/homoserine/homoserine lactone efflux protein
MSSLVEFTVISLLLVISPGPNGALIIKTLSSLGPSHSVANIVGLFIATFIHGALSIFGLSTAINHMPAIYSAIKILGALYLTYIGIKAIIGVFKKVTSDSDNNTRQHIKIRARHKYRSSFIEGFLTQILNPKVSMFYLAAFPQFINFNDNSYVSSFTLVLIHASIIFSWFLGITVSYKHLSYMVGKSSFVSESIQVVMGLVLIYFGLMLSGFFSYAFSK